MVNLFTIFTFGINNERLTKGGTIMRDFDFYSLDEIPIDKRTINERNPMARLNTNSAIFSFNTSSVQRFGLKPLKKFRIAFRSKKNESSIFVQINPTDSKEISFSVSNNMFCSRALSNAIEKIVGLGLTGRFIIRFEVSKVGDNVFRLKFKNSTPVLVKQKD